MTPKEPNLSKRKRPPTSLSKAAKNLTKSSKQGQPVAISERNEHASVKRGQQTRERIIQAAVKCISEESYSAASTYRIIEVAGVSWGSLQYHFGGKNGVNSAVIMAGMESLEEALSNLLIEGETLEERITSFIDASWHCFRQPEPRAAFEVIFNAYSDTKIDALSLRRQEEMSEELHNLLHEALRKAANQEVNCTGIESLIVSAFRGFAVTFLQHKYNYEFKDQRKALASLICSYIHHQQTTSTG